MVSNLNINNILAKFSGQASDGVLSAIQKASDNTGVDFAYLVQQAKAESSFNPTAQAKTSSASGLYQFIESTWMQTVNKHGDKYGVETEGLSRTQILNLRKDPEIASNMAAEFALENQKFLQKNWGGNIGSTELYLAHFMGAGGAASFLNAKDETPLAPAADIFPRAAKANRAVFYDSKTGEPRSLASVYDFFDKKFQMKMEEHNTGEEDALPSTVFQNKNAAPSMDQNSYEHFLFSELSKRGMNAFGDQGNTNPFRAFSRENRTMPLYSLVQSPAMLMMMAENDIPGAQSANEERSGHKNNSDRTKNLSI